MEVPGRKFFVLLVALLAVATAAEVSEAGGGGWRAEPAVPVARSEVAAAVWHGRIVVAGGFLESGRSSARVDAFDPRTRRWARLPDLPQAVNHAMAASDGKTLYVLGGYSDADEDGSEVLDTAYAFNGRSWAALPPLPAPRAAAGAAFAAGKLFVVGGVIGPARLARESLVYDPKRRSWSAIDGPTPREHLGVTALGGRVYAVGGRSAGFDTNLDVVESYRPGDGSWSRLPSVPGRRGGTGLAAGRGQLVSVGGEAPGGTIAEVYSYDVGDRRWRRLPDLTAPRHGLGVEFLGGRIYALAGGPEPGLSVSGANESLALPPSSRRHGAAP
jgi:N-acetylneuraminic acid mutarotase